MRAEREKSLQKAEEPGCDRQTVFLSTEENSFCLEWCFLYNLVGVGVGVGVGGFF